MPKNSNDFFRKIIAAGRRYEYTQSMEKDNTKNRTFLATALVSLSMVFYGISFPATRVALTQYKPISLVTARLIISAVLLMSINTILYGRKGFPRWGDLPKFLLIALFQPFFYFLFETFGLQSVSAAISSVIIATIPVFTPIGARVFLKEKLTFYPISGALLSLIGVVLLVSFSRGEDTLIRNFTAKGLLLLFGAVFSAVLYSLAVRRLPVSYSPLTITAVQNSLGLLFFLPVFFIFEASDAFAVVPNSETIFSILFLAVFASSLAFIFLNYGIQQIGPSRANGLVNLVPVITAIVSFLFFGEQFSSSKIIGMGVVLAGVLLAQAGKIKGKKKGK